MEILLHTIFGYICAGAILVFIIEISAYLSSLNKIVDYNPKFVHYIITLIAWPYILIKAIQLYKQMKN